MKLNRAAAATLALALLSTACKKESAEQAAEKAAGALNGDKVQSIGRAHLPDICQVVVSVDWSKFRELKSVKGDVERLLTQFEQPPVPNAPIDPETAASLKQLREFLTKTRIDLRKDPGELALCFWKMDERVADKPPTFVAVLGGQFVPGAAAQALDSFPEKLKAFFSRARSGPADAPPPEIIEIAGVKVAHDKTDGIYLGQAKDGAFVLSSDRVVFEKALVASKAHEAYRLPSEAISVALAKSGTPLFAPQLAQSPLAPLATTLTGARMAMREGTLTLWIDGSDPAALAAARGNLQMLATPDPRMPPNPFTQALAGAKIVVEGSTLTLDVPLPDEMAQGVLQQAVPAGPRPHMGPGGPMGPRGPIGGPMQGGPVQGGPVQGGAVQGGPVPPAPQSP
ncbi:MAG TPA: hypothetical protein VLC09_18430 [Polyangiaceae bacterium]|nr:hypothetical protein [Polyangiaceae bacterium]